MTIKRYSEDTWVTEYLNIIQVPRAEKRLTDTWVVNDKYGNHLGQVSWFNHWRRYVFAPNASTIFEQVCLRDIAQFIEERTSERKQPKKVEAQSEA